jgi:hypothetical protein
VEEGPAQRAVIAGGRRWRWGKPTTERIAESHRTLGRVQELLAQGDYAAAVRLVYRTAFDTTVEAYGLTVPPSMTDRQFLKEFLRADMGVLSELLPELYRYYEPVKFGRLENGDRAAVETLLNRLVSETVLARIDDPGYRSASTPPVQQRVTDTAPLTRPLKPGEGA